MRAASSSRRSSAPPSVPRPPRATAVAGAGWRAVAARPPARSCSAALRSPSPSPDRRGPFAPDAPVYHTVCAGVTTVRPHGGRRTPGLRLRSGAVPTDKRQRKRDNAQLRRAAIEAQQRKARTRRQAVTVVVLVALLTGVVFLFTRGGDDGDDVTTATTAATPTTAAASTTTAGDAATRAFAYGTGECPNADGSSPKTLKFDA